MKIQKREYTRMGETLYVAEHSSGLKVYFIPKKDYTKKHAFFATRYGALYNRFEREGEVHEMPLGIAHFLEHKIFEDQAESTFEKFSRIGADVNAYTNYLSTVYLFSTVDHFDVGLGYLMNFVQNLHLTPENVEKEKGIITQEINMYDDDPEWQSYFNITKAMYREHPIKEDIAGTVASVTDITIEDLTLCFESFYTPDNMALFIIGDLDREEAFASVEKYLEPEFLARQSTGKLLLPEEPTLPLQSFLEKKMEVSTPLFTLGFKDDASVVGYKHSIAMRLLLDMNFGRGSDLYKSLYDEGMIDQNFSADYTFGVGYGYSVLSGESEEPEAVRDRFFEAIASLKEKGLSRTDFDRVVKKRKGRFISSFNSPQAMANAFISYDMKGINVFDYLDILDQITFEEVTEIFNKHFVIEHASLSVIR